MPLKASQEESNRNDKQELYISLGKASPSAIQQLAKRIQPDVRKACLDVGLSLEDAEELLNDVLVITIANIRKQTFEFQDFHPAAYAMGVLRKLLANKIRSKKPPTETIEHLSEHSKLNPEKYYEDKERQVIVGQLLHKLGDTCRQLIEMKYYQHYRDKELLEKKLVPFSTINSLKSKRSQCLKQLASLAKAAGIYKVF